MNAPKTAANKTVRGEAIRAIAPLLLLLLLPLPVVVPVEFVFERGVNPGLLEVVVTKPDEEPGLELPFGAATRAVVAEGTAGVGVFAGAVVGGMLALPGVEPVVPLLVMAFWPTFNCEPSICPAGAVEGGGVPGVERKPWPQGIAEPSGSVALGGVDTVPVASVIDQRPVQVTLVIPSAVNW